MPKRNGRRRIPPEFIKSAVGRNNANLRAAADRLTHGNTYRDLSTIWLTPTRGAIKSQVVSSWMGVMRPMNQMFLGPLFIVGDEVGEAYQKAFDMVLGHPELSQWRYILTVEDDNLPPADGVMQLYKSIEQGYDCVGGLYWTKSTDGEEVYSQPMIYGDPAVMPKNFIPQVPRLDTLQPCNGLGMGFNLWKIDSLRNKLAAMPKPWFKTVQEQGRAFTQDLYFYYEAAKYGFRVACDTRVRVGHIDRNDIVW